MNSIDQLCKQLGICNPTKQSTCIGYGKKKPTCGITVAGSSRWHAFELLEDVERDRRAGARISDTTLHNIAALLLCKQWHQRQAGENVERWKRNLRQRPTTPQQISPFAETSDSASGSRSLTQTAARQPSVRSFTDRELLQEVIRRLSDPNRVGFSQSVCDIVRPFIEADGEEHNNNRTETANNPSDENRDYNNDNNNHSQRATSSDVRTSSRLQSTNNSVSRTRTTSQESQRDSPATYVDRGRQLNSERRPAPASDTVRQARIAALSNSNTSTLPETPESQAVQIRAPSPLRQSHVECVICVSPLEEDADEYWECGTCLNRVHQECFAQWSTAESSGRPTRCMFCRVDTLS